MNWGSYAPPKSVIKKLLPVAVTGGLLLVYIYRNDVVRGYKNILKSYFNKKEGEDIEDIVNKLKSTEDIYEGIVPARLRNADLDYGYSIHTLTDNEDSTQGNRFTGENTLRKHSYKLF